MEIKARFDHFNFNVTDLARSIAFYDKALGLKPCSEIADPKGNFKIVYLCDAEKTFLLELTWLKDHPQRYDLGECEFHLCLRVPGDYDEVRRYHREMGCLCFENEEMGLYFIEDPDGYWIEVLPLRRNNGY
ncbi:MAG: VOC family protein [Alloprevotella sp.]